ncbi:MAG: S8 family peptidase [Cyanobacteriota bacterium]|nr:S8 family peptidase [Cyanobacteriota bacterium]
MNSSSHSSLGSQRTFNSALLDRTVIAIPLLEQIQEEIEMINWAWANYPEWFDSFNCAIILNPAYPGGAQPAYQAAKELVRQAKDRFPEDEASNQLEEPKSIDKYCFAVASLSQRVRRKILALNHDLSEPPIKSILPTLYDVIIDLNLGYYAGREKAKKWVESHVPKAIKKVLGDTVDVEQKVRKRTEYSQQYVFARMEARALLELMEMDKEAAQKKLSLPQERSAAGGRQSKKTTAPPAMPAIEDGQQKKDLYKFHAIHHVWPDFRIHSCITHSVATVKADAALSSFSAAGNGITWAVMDSGIQADHPHFRLHNNIDVDSDLHFDLTDTEDLGKEKNGALTDAFGHGTHVAGIIAGEQRAVGPDASPESMRAVTRTIESFQDGSPGKVTTQTILLKSIRGMAPQCKLVSIKVLDEDGDGQVSGLITAINHIQKVNSNGRDLRIQGVNMSLGYEFEAEWFACGQSPLCIEVNRLVRSGVVVVVAAGNTGYGVLSARERGTSAGLALTINDPGNADLAITVGSTHREMPHVYGVSFFSSKGPTGDGRLKPDMVAPGEKILSCATGRFMREKGKRDLAGNSLDCDYVEESGTSMAAPHVSGVIAAFLSVRREFIGEPEKVKKIFVSTCTDLGRINSFQGAGLVDLMRAIQSV